MPRPARAVGALLLLGACSASWGDGEGQGVASSGAGGSRSYAVRDFDTVSLAAVGDVEVRVGPEWSVVATGAPDLLDRIVVARDGGTLILGRRRGVQWSRGEKVRFLVAMPRIAGAAIGGAGEIAIDRVPEGSFEGRIGGSGRIDVRAMAVDRAEFAIGGSGNVAAAGRARALTVDIGGSGNVRAAPLSVETAEITIAGAGDVEATASRTAAVTILGSGNVAVGGGARCSTTRLGVGTVRCG